ncbi:MAG: PorV/PorQ family protein [Elusimicrobiota bacterium]
MELNKLLKAAVCSIVAVSTVWSLASAGVGKTGAQFLKIIPSARSAGMGCAFAGLADDVYAVYSNPAGLAQLEKAEFAATYMKYFADVNYGYIGYASKVRDLGVFGIGYTYLLVPGIEKRDLDETKLGEFNATDISLAVAYAWKDAMPSLLENVSVGCAVKLINSQIDTAVAYTAALDVAAMYSPIKNFNTALVLQNVGAGIKFREVSDPLPLNLKLGLSYKAMEGLAINGELDEYLSDNKFYASIGAEYWPLKQLALRGGYRFGYHKDSLGQNVGIAGGVGFRIWDMSVDYAFVPFGELGDTHRMSFGVKF